MKVYKLDNKKVTMLDMYDGSAIYIGATVIQFALSFILSVVLLATQVAESFTESMTYLILVSILNQLSLTLGIAAYSKIKSTNVFKEMGFQKLISPLQILIIVGIAFATFAAFSPMSTAFSTLMIKLGYNSVLTKGLVIDTAGKYILLVVVLCLLPAVVEEMLYRGVVARSFVSAKGFIWSTLIGALAFSLMHGSPAQLIYQFFLGAVCCLLYYMTRSIYSSMILHFTSNFIVITGGYIESFGVNLSTTLLQNVLLTIAGFIVLPLLLFAFYYVSMKKVKGVTSLKNFNQNLKLAFMLDDERKVLENEKKTILEDMDAFSDSEDAQMIYDRYLIEQKKKIAKRNSKAVAYMFVLLVILWIINTVSGFMG